MKKYEERFWSRVTKTVSCWLWHGAKDIDGYGVYWIGKIIKAHRYSWQLANGPLPETKLVLHNCDTPGCVNPGHLRLGTHQENMHDRLVRGRTMKRECHWKAALTSHDIQAIRSSRQSNRELAEIYGVTQSHVNNIRKYRVWK